MLKWKETQGHPELHLVVQFEGVCSSSFHSSEQSFYSLYIKSCGILFAEIITKLVLYY